MKVLMEEIEKKKMCNEKWKWNEEEEEISK